jgi:hypothetical protein
MVIVLSGERQPLLDEIVGCTADLDCPLQNEIEVVKVGRTGGEIKDRPDHDGQGVFEV